MTAMYEAAYAYFACLYALAILILFSGERGPMLRTILAIAISNALANAYTLVTRDTDPFWWFMAVDFAAAAIVLLQPAGRAQAIIGWTFIGKLAMHTGYGLTLLYGDPDAVRYWWALTLVGFLQLIFVGSWYAHSRWRPSLRDLCRVGRVASSASPPGMAR